MFYGADTEQLRRWAERVASSATTVRGDVGQTIHSAPAVAWEGTDAEDFRSRVRQLHDALTSTSERLAGVGADGRLHAEEQDQASTPDGATGPTAEVPLRRLATSTGTPMASRDATSPTCLSRTGGPGELGEHGRAMDRSRHGRTGSGR